jgi:hypothetical protein
MDLVAYQPGGHLGPFEAVRPSSIQTWLFELEIDEFGRARQEFVQA